MSDASAEMARAQKLGLDGATDYTALKVSAYFLMGDADGVRRMGGLVAGRPDEFLVTLALAGTQQFSGQFKQAAATIQEAFDQAGPLKTPDVQARAFLTTPGPGAWRGL